MNIVWIPTSPYIAARNTLSEVIDSTAIGLIY
jgi:hypothetical protein